jgi:hypothetical protein
MNLVNKKKISRNGIDYLIDINKVFYSNVGGDDYYNYEIYIYNANIKNKKVKKHFFKKDEITHEYECIYKYKTYWLNYFKYHGDIDSVIKEAFEKYEWNLREQKYISEKENTWKE